LRIRAARSALLFMGHECPQPAKFSKEKGIPTLFIDKQ
jgi:hypothetical protein